MKFIRRMMREGKTRWLELLQRRSVPIDLEKPIVSISFDDVPNSTFINGLPVLNQYGFKATFYACLDMPENADLLGPEQLLRLHAEGHEIGCHTASHYFLDSGNAADLADDAFRNRKLFLELLGGMVPESFSFPFGTLSHEAKRVLSPHYRTLRSGRSGVNAGVCDFNCLRAISLRHGEFNKGLVESWLDYAERKRGWVIFYSHGIVFEPETYDITPVMLDILLNAIKRRRFPVLPVGHAAKLLDSSAVT